LDEQAGQIFAITDVIAERVRKIGGTTLRSIGQISRQQRVLDNDAEYVTPLDMLAELRDDNLQLVAHMRETHHLCDEHGDVATQRVCSRYGSTRPSGGLGSCTKQAVGWNPAADPISTRLLASESFHLPFACSRRGYDF